MDSSGDAGRGGNAMGGASALGVGKPKVTGEGALCDVKDGSGECSDVGCGVPLPTDG